LLPVITTTPIITSKVRDPNVTPKLTFADTDIYSK
jgi:hypothetical protein